RAAFRIIRRQPDGRRLARRRCHDADCGLGYRHFCSSAPGGDNRSAPGDAQRMKEAVSGTAADLRPPHLIRARSLTRDNVTLDPIARFKKAFSDDDAAALRQLFIDHPELKARVNEPLFPFDSPAIT